MPTERELLALCLRWLEHPGLVHPFDKAMLVEALKAKLEPEPRPWVGLTEDEIVQIGVATGLNRVAVGMIENKLKEKNQ
jgi:hypothetical protein